MGLTAAQGSAIFGAVPALYQMGTGIVQGIRGRKLAKKTKRPVYEIPQEILANQKLAKNAYSAASAYGLPGQGRIQAGMDQSQANAARGISMSQQSPSSQLLGYAALDQNSKNAANQLGIQSATFRQGNMDRTRQGLMGANGILAQYRDKEFDYNKTKPFEATMAAISALRKGSIENIYGGLSSLANTAGALLNRGGTGGGGTGAKSTGSINSGQPSQFGSYYAEETSRLRSLPQFQGMSDDEFYYIFGEQGMPK